MAMELQLPIQEQGYSPAKTLLVMGIHAPIRRAATAERQRTVPPQQEERGAVPPQQEKRGAVPPQQEERGVVPPQQEERGAVPPQQEALNAVGAVTIPIKMSWSSE